MFWVQLSNCYPCHCKCRYFFQSKQNILLSFIYYCIHSLFGAYFNCVMRCSSWYDDYHYFLRQVVIAKWMKSQTFKTEAWSFHLRMYKLQSLTDQQRYPSKIVFFLPLQIPGNFSCFQNGVNLEENPIGTSILKSKLKLSSIFSIQNFHAETGKLYTLTFLFYVLCDFEECIWSY